ncbi:MAG: signal peptidase I [Gemmatimonadetes bacterium]|nr:signal peptidase I [Gemmatimonadota bacterium]
MDESMAKKDKPENPEEAAATEAASPPTGSKTRKRAAQEETRDANSPAEWAKSIVIALALFLFLRTFIIQTFVITSGSMEDTLLVGDMLVVNRVGIGSRIPGTDIRIPGYSEPRLNDVLVFDPPHEETLKLIKRLIGMPGDTLEMRNRALYRNGQLVDEPYVVHSGNPDEGHPWMEWQKSYLASTVDPRTYSPTRDTWGPIVLPEDRYFMLGDNREASLDSRYWGILEGWRLEGRAVFTYFSYNKGSYRPFPWIREIRWGRIFQGID